MIDLYKNYLDKCHLVSIASASFKKMIEKSSDPKESEELLDLTEYALSFLVSMNLNQLATSMNQNKPIFKLDDKLEELFLGSSEHEAMKKIVNLMNSLSQEKTEKRKEILLSEKNKIMEANQMVK